MDARKRGWGGERGWPDSSVPGFRSGLRRVAQSIRGGVLKQNGGTVDLPEGTPQPGNHPSSRKFRSQDAGNTQRGEGIRREPKALSWTPSGLSVPPLLDLHGLCLRGGRRGEGGRERERGREGGGLHRQGDSQPPAWSSLGRGGEEGGPLTRSGSSRLAGWPTGWGCWRGGCAARTVAGRGIQTSAFLRCWREASVEVGRGGQEAAEGATHISYKWRGGRGGGSAVGVRAERSGGSFSKLWLGGET